MSNWTFEHPLETLSTQETNEKSLALWDSEDLGGLTEDNNPLPVPIVWLVVLTVFTAFAVTFPLWGQRPTAAIYAPLVHVMDNANVVAAPNDDEAMNRILSLVKNANVDKAQLDRHPLSMDDLRLIAPQISALEAKGADLRDFTVVGPNVVTANFEGNLRPDGSRMRQQPWWDKGYTIDIFYLSAFFLGVFIVVKRLPPNSWKPTHGKHSH